MNTDTLPSKRPYTKKRDCPSCQRPVEFWHTSGMAACAPHFYCERCSSVIWRAGDAETVARLGKNEATAVAIVATLPPCGCGGHFIAGSGPKCPHCGFLFQHQSSVADRLLDPYLILVDGATFYHEK